MDRRTVETSRLSRAAPARPVSWLMGETTGLLRRHSALARIIGWRSHGGRALYHRAVAGAFVSRCRKFALGPGGGSLSREARCSRIRGPHRRSRSSLQSGCERRRRGRALGTREDRQGGREAGALAVFKKRDEFARAKADFDVVCPPCRTASSRNHCAPRRRPRPHRAPRSRPAPQRRARRKMPRHRLSFPARRRRPCRPRCRPSSQRWHPGYRPMASGPTRSNSTAIASWPDPGRQSLARHPGRP